MGVESGGRASKLGDTYERLFAVLQALQVIDARYRSIQWEPIGEDELGIDLWVTANDGRRIGYQLKRQNRSKEYWSPADLVADGIVQDARQQLERDPRAEYVFVSSCGVRSLRDLSEQSRRAGDSSAAFVANHVDTERNRKKDFGRLLSAWGLKPTAPDDVDKAIKLLRRMTFEVFERTERKRHEVEHIASLQIEGEPKRLAADIGDLLDSNLGHEFRADELRARLEARGLRFRRLAGDPSLPKAITELQNRFDRAIRPHLIAGRSIPRPECDQIVDSILSDHPPRVIFVHGGAGGGKSVILHQVFETLTARGTLVLPLQLHVLRPSGTPDQFGRTKCALSGSPALSLHALGGDRRVVLILDQLDALRMTSAHSQEVWGAFLALIQDALATPLLTVVAACRSFDLENDPNIAAWRREVARGEGDELEMPVGPLSEEHVAEIMRPLGTAYENLSARQRSLLRQPYNLALWYTLAEASEGPRQFDNATDLMKHFIAMRRGELTAHYGIPTSEVAHVLSTLTNYLDTEGQLDAPEALVSNFGPVVDAMCSVGLLDRSDGIITFAHQTYFDHLVAERALAESITENWDICQWLRANQSLFRRDQLRQLLTLLRDSVPFRHGALLRSILLGDDIRFHLKHLVLGLLRAADPVSEAEAALVADLSERTEWWEHLRSTVIMGRPPWFDALDQHGVLADWIEHPRNEEHLRDVLMFLRSVTPARGERIDALLQPYWGLSGLWPDRLLHLLSCNPCVDSPNMAKLRLDKLRAGEIAFQDIFARELAERSPTRLVALLNAALGAWLKEFRACLRAPAGKDVPRWHFLEASDSRVIQAFEQAGAAAWEETAATLRMVSRLARAGQRVMDFDAQLALDPAHECLEQLVAASVRGIARTDIRQITRLLEVPERQQRGLEHAIATGLAAGDAALADRAILWLLGKSSRFHLGDGHNEIYWEPARALITHFAGACSERVFQQLESAILAYHESWERRSVELQVEDVRRGVLRPNDWGRAQNVLLAALPPSRTSPSAQSAARAWQAKFGDPANEQPTRMHAKGGWIVSPIPPRRVHSVSDRNWLEIIRKEWPASGGGRWRQHEDEVVGEASLRTFSKAFGHAARQNPARFVALALRVPPDSAPAYFVSLLRELTPTSPPEGIGAWEPATVADLERIMKHLADLKDEGYSREVCRAIVERDEAAWSKAAIERLGLLAQHPHPAPGEFTSYSGSGESAQPDVGNTGLNCVRGAAARAISALLWRQADAFDLLLEPAKHLLKDPHPSVRYEALGLCLPIWRHDQDLAAQLCISACAHEDDRILASHWLQQFIRDARVKHAEQLTPLIERMARSSVLDVATKGAMWATAFWLDGAPNSRLVDACVAGSAAQRNGVAIAVVDWFAAGEQTDQTAPILKAFFDDRDPEIGRRAARVFYRPSVFDVPASADLAVAFVLSTAFREDPDRLLQPLSEYGGDLKRFSSVVLQAADVVARNLADETRTMQGRNAFAGNQLSALLLRLYDHAHGTHDVHLESDCLDRWDSMLEKRVGMTETHLKLLDG